MSKDVAVEIRSAILALLPEDGSAIGNKAMRDQIAAKLGAGVDVPPPSVAGRSRVLG